MPNGQTNNITITLLQATETYPALTELADIPMPAKASYRIGKMQRKIATEVQGFTNTRNAVIEKYGDELGEKGQFKVAKENIAQFNAEMEVLLEEQVTLTGVAKIDFEDIENIEVKPSTIAALEPLINE